LKSGVDIKSSRPRERLDHRRHGSANEKLYSAVTAASWHGPQAEESALGQRWLGSCPNRVSDDMAVSGSSR
jgi:hypothetical protein